MMSTELASYVLLLSLPIWLLVEQLIHLRSAPREKLPRPAERVARQPLSQALRSGQK
jgi:ABC-type nickel/cobalt efflux system permease component RcnA